MAMMAIKRHTTTNKIYRICDAHVVVDCDIDACECGLERICASRSSHRHTHAHTQTSHSGATEIYGAFQCERVCVSSFRRNSTKRRKNRENKINQIIMPTDGKETE